MTGYSYERVKISGYNDRLKRTLDARSQQCIRPETNTKRNLISQRYQYWPTDAVPFACALALLEVVLDKSIEARSLYSKILEAWKLPGCQEMITEFMLQKQKTSEWEDGVIRAIDVGESIPDWPQAWHNAIEKGKTNIDWQILMTAMNNFITQSFNRKKDLVNKQPKVIADEAPNLEAAVCVRSIADYCNTDLNELAKYHDIRVDGVRYDLDRIMNTKPTTSSDRKLKQATINLYNSTAVDFTHKHDRKLIKDAELWYYSRVVYDSIEQFSLVFWRHKDIWNDPRNVGKKIAVFDLATGYPRKEPTS